MGGMDTLSGLDRQAYLVESRFSSFWPLMLDMLRTVYRLHPAI